MLVLQMPETLLTFDEIIEQEDLLIAGLKNLAIVDGHDIGSGEVNFFILTDNVNVTFERVQTLLKSQTKSAVKAAYRKVTGEKYSILYPPDLKAFRIL
jgi:hypothetical protein